MDINFRLQGHSEALFRHALDCANSASMGPEGRAMTPAEFAESMIMHLLSEDAQAHGEMPSLRAH